ncbi:MAG: diguanylate cyclase [Pseudazoarcus pumilus]|nr:diguanylate cyclase [Pseudazoarcus pumilus]
MKHLRRLALLLLLALSAGAGATQQLVLGVLAVRPKPVMFERLQPLADYLDAELPDTDITLQVLDQDELELALAQHRLDLVLTNPSHYLIIRSRDSLGGALATVLSHENGTSVGSLGGVIITLEHRKEIAEIADLRGQRIGIAGTRDLGGFQAQALELVDAGLSIERDFRFVEMEHHDAVLQAVLDGEVDAGFIRSGLLEGFALEHPEARPSLRVLHPQHLADFPYAVSTRLYPEWPLVALSSIDQDAVRQITTALLTLPPDHPAAQAAHIGGFAPPADYLPVERLARTLRMPPYDEPPPIAPRDVWEQYWPYLAGGGAALLVISALLAMLSRRNRQLVHLVRERDLAQSGLELAASVFSHAREGILITDARQRILDVNDAFTRLTGYTRAEAVGNTPQILRPTRQSEAFQAAQQRSLDEHGYWEGESWSRHRNGEERAHLLTMTAVHNADDQVSHFVMLFSDITRQKEVEAQLKRNAHYDALTGLPNRVLLADRLNQAMAHARRGDRQLALAYIDLDGFKEVNDGYGHQAGDHLLVVLAERMRATLRESDTVARLGGDEFVTVLANQTDQAASIALVQRMLEALNAPVPYQGESLAVSASIGLAFFPQQASMDADQFLRQADQAMYRAKLSGKNRFHVFGSEGPALNGGPPST